ncbi:hypothetical protein E2C01_026378 [Portunus trituberculatus]|uniref:Uncharacterized protein n=1 Tax=Portunus trituberculatus TaxID=210409 RepID=A0A5B7EIP7_PORTR|nr:hypothetical protein [Portunus trituberculatus]
MTHMLAHHMNKLSNKYKILPPSCKGGKGKCSYLRSSTSSSWSSSSSSSSFSFSSISCSSFSSSAFVYTTEQSITFANNTSGWESFLKLRRRRGRGNYPQPSEVGVGMRGMAVGGDLEKGVGGKYVGAGREGRKGRKGRKGTLGLAI